MNEKCSHPENCTNKAVKKGLCEKHYRRFKKYGALGPVEHLREYNNSNICKVDQCNLETWAKGYCNMHYKRFSKEGNPGDATRKRNDLQIDCPDNMKSCRKCNEIKLLTEFSNAKKGHKGKMSRCKLCERYKTIENTHGFNKEKYDELMKDAKCQICKSTKRLSVDHCHTSGKFRNILCANCNSAIGLLQDNPDIIKEAKKYVEHYLHLKEL